MVPILRGLDRVLVQTRPTASFIRTTNVKHRALVTKFVNRVNAVDLPHSDALILESD